MQLRKESLKKFNDQLPVGLLPQLARTQHWFRSGQGSKFSLTFFQAFFMQLHKLRILL